jgi:hypothetical protein
VCVFFDVRDMKVIGHFRVSFDVVTETVHGTVSDRSVDPKCIPKPFIPGAACETSVHDVLAPPPTPSTRIPPHTFCAHLPHVVVYDKPWKSERNLRLVAFLLPVMM